MGRNVTFESEEVRQMYLNLFEEYGYMHVNWEDNTVITFDHIEGLKKDLEVFDD